MNDDNKVRGLGEIFLQALFEAPGVLVASAQRIQQRELEEAVLAHVRNQPHNQTICSSCAPTVPATAVKDCTVHDFGKCVVDCRYRTGFPGKCTKEKDWPYSHGDGNCKPDCYGRP